MLESGYIFRLKVAFKAQKTWLLVNALGICIYAMFEACILAPRSEAESFNGIDQIFFWYATQMPVLFIFCALNLVWLITIIKKGFSKEQWTSLVIWLFAFSAWAIVFCAFGFGPHEVKTLMIILMTHRRHP